MVVHCAHCGAVAFNSPGATLVERAFCNPACSAAWHALYDAPQGEPLRGLGDVFGGGAGNG